MAKRRTTKTTKEPIYAGDNPLYIAQVALAAKVPQREALVIVKVMRAMHGTLDHLASDEFTSTIRVARRLLKDKEHRKLVEDELGEPLSYRFEDLSIGDMFDFISPDSHMNSFYERCVKVGPRTYDSDSAGGHKVGTVKAKVYHVELKRITNIMEQLTADALKAKAK